MKDRSEPKHLQGNRNLSRSWLKTRVTGRAKAGLPLPQAGIGLSPKELTLPGRALTGTLKSSFCIPNTTDKFYPRNTEARNCPSGFSCSFLSSVKSCENKVPFFPFMFSRSFSGSNCLVQCLTLGMSLINKARSTATVEFVSHNTAYKQIRQ